RPTRGSGLSLLAAAAQADTTSGLCGQGRGPTIAAPDAMLSHEPAFDRDDHDNAPRQGEPSNVVQLPAAPEPAADAERLPLPALLYVLLVFLAGLVSVGAFAVELNADDVAGLVLVGALAVAFGRTKVPIYGDTAVSIGMVGDFAVAFLFGAPGAAVV